MDAISWNEFGHLCTVKGEDLWEHSRNGNDLYELLVSFPNDFPIDPDCSKLAEKVTNNLHVTVGS